ncbi:DUF6525 family protein [Natronohydrobacter thiooxidans]|jgi:hypothetical protein|uniref:DUF6525 family protein n=1 Tax=Natronohydrobacter thiooxidans TaxID=87172 RepID=UPI0008FF770D|nr:DUF6525 family protein [Natronohydrobacter thiooxidans]
MRRNLSTSLKHRRASPMARHDRLPRELRLWLAQAALPWSAQSALKLWQRALREARGDTRAAQAILSRIEARLIARDAAQVWGAGHPAALSA